MMATSTTALSRISHLVCIAVLLPYVVFVDVVSHEREALAIGA